MPAPSPTKLAGLTLAGFSERLASSEPVPGGGSASAVAGSFGAALAAMVARLSSDRPRYADHAATHDRVLGAAEAARSRLLELADEDAVAYGAFAAANRLPRATAEEQAGRELATQAAARDATLVPLETLRLCRTVAELVEALAGRSNVNAASDLDVAAHLVEAAAAGAAANVRINLPSLGDAPEAARIERQVADLEAAVQRDVAGAHVATKGTPRAPEPAG
ncbi:MAG: cyclodeaminase/cyclohydrolase family protein [Candidatus Limnocylindrales bacterium]